MSTLKEALDVQLGVLAIAAQIPIAVQPDPARVYQERPKFRTLKADPARSLFRVEQGFTLRRDPRGIEELKRSIIKSGIKQPLHVRQQDKVYIIEDGHRRFAALREAMKEGHRFDPIPVHICKPRPETERIYDQFARNLSLPLSLLEQADGVQRLREQGCTDADIVDRAGFSDSHFARIKLMILAPDDAKQLVSVCKISGSLLIDIMNEGYRGAELSALLRLAEAKAETSLSVRILPRHFTPDVWKRKIRKGPLPVVDQLPYRKFRKLMEGSEFPEDAEMQARLKGARVVLDMLERNLAPELALSALRQES